jgi:hypothetical protein
MIHHTRAPFTDEAARALADEANLAHLAARFDPLDRGIRDIWEVIVATGRRCSEVTELRLDCTGRYGGLPLLWHDQTKVGNYDEAVRIPEYIHQRITERQAKTLAWFAYHHGRQPSPAERAQLALFPPDTATCTAAGRSPTPPSDGHSATGWTSLTSVPGTSPTRPGTRWPPGCK